MPTWPAIKTSMLYSVVAAAAGASVVSGYWLTQSVADSDTPPAGDVSSGVGPAVIVLAPSQPTTTTYRPGTSRTPDILRPDADLPDADAPTTDLNAPRSRTDIYGEREKPLDLVPTEPSDANDKPIEIDIISGGSGRSASGSTRYGGSGGATQEAGGGISINPSTGGGGGGGGGSIGSGGGGGGGGGGSGGGASPAAPTDDAPATGGGASAGSGGGLQGPTQEDLAQLEDDPVEEELIDALATESESASTGDTRYDAGELIALTSHPDALTDAQLLALTNDIRSGALTLAPDGRADETTRLQAAFDAGGDIVLQAGTWPTQPIVISQDNTRLLVEPGAVLQLRTTGELTSVIEVGGDGCTIIGLTADGGGTATPQHAGRHETIRVTGDDNRLINCTTRGSGRLSNGNRHSQTGIAVYGNANLLESCVSHDAAYAGIFNFGDDNFYRGCAACNYCYKGFNQGQNGRDVTRLTIDGWYSESSRGNGSIDFDHGGVYPIGLQLDAHKHQLREAILRDIRIGPHPDGIGGVKLATADRVIIEGLYVEVSDDFNRASLILAEGLGLVQVTGGVLHRGVTHFPPADAEQPLVDQLILVDVTLGRDEPTEQTKLHDHLLARNLVYRDCTFKGIRWIAIIPETPNDDIADWLIEGCRFICPMDAGTRAQVMYPRLGVAPGFENLTLAESGKLRFLDNTLEAPNGAQMMLSTQAWFAPLLQTVGSSGSRYHFDQLPSDPRITWHAGDTARIGDLPGEWVCIEGGRPGSWVAGAWD